MDRLTSLTVFVRVVEMGGFSAAGRRLNMSATMVSNHIQSLETGLGARLLNRTTRKVSLTEIGMTYYERCVQILSDIDEADRIAGALQATPKGTLRLYSTASILRFIVPVIDDYLTRYPEIAVDLTSGDWVIDLIEDRFDLAIRAVAPPNSSLIVRRLAGWRHILCCAPHYLLSHDAPTRLADLPDHNCLRFSLYPFGDEWHFAGPGGKPEKIKISGNFVSNSAETLRLMALAGQGVFLAPSFLLTDELSTGQLVRLLPEHSPVEFAINAVYPHRHQLSIKVRCFLDLLAERFAAHNRWLDPPIAAGKGG